MRTVSGKEDARTARWHGHRAKVRAEIVDAAFRALDKCGPEVSLQQIAAEAGTAKPKIYRHFTDKADLFHAISRRFRDLLLARIIPNVDVTVDPTRDVVGRAVAEYVAFVTEHPNVVRFILQGRFPEPADPTNRGLSEGPDITMAIAEMFNAQLPETHLETAALESALGLAAASAFGSAAAATDWWLGPNPDSPPRMSADQFVAHLTILMLGTVSGTAHLLGVVVDLDLPIGAAVPREATLGGSSRHA